MPINHIANYAQFLDGLLNEYKSRDLLADDFKTVAAVEIEMKKLQKFVVENYMLNSMKGLSVNNFFLKFILSHIVILDLFVGATCAKIWYHHIFR